MLKTLIITALFVTSVAVEHASSYTENCISEFCFTTPGSSGMRNFDHAKAWCIEHNSTWAVVDDSDTQMAMTHFLISSNMSETMFINIKLSHKLDETWFVVNGSKYYGSVGSLQNFTIAYELYCYLKPHARVFLVEASIPRALRSYICDYEGTRCQSNSTVNLPFKERCYVKYENENLTWYEAMEKCVKNGGDLARFQYEAVGDSWIPPFGTSWLNTSLSYWVGIRWNDWSWNYSDESKEVIYTSWSKGKPNNYNYSCACVDPNGNPIWSWKDCDCDKERQFVCMKIVHTTTVITTTPTTTTTTSTTTKTPSTTNVTDKLSQQQIIGLGVGIGGGVLIIIVIVIIVLAVVSKRRQRKSNESSESRFAVENSGENNDEVKPTEMTASDGKALYSQVHKPPRNQVNTSREKDAYAQVNKHPQNQVNNDVYAKVVSDGKQQVDKTESSPEIIYLAPEFAQDPKSTPPSSNYEVAYRVHEPDMVPTLRGQTQSIFPIRYSSAYANDKEAE